MTVKNPCLWASLKAKHQAWKCPSTALVILKHVEKIHAYHVKVLWPQGLKVKVAHSLSDRLCDPFLLIKKKKKQGWTSCSFKIRNHTKSCSINSKKGTRTKAMAFFFGIFSLPLLNVILSCSDMCRHDISSLGRRGAYEKSSLVPCYSVNRIRKLCYLDIVRKMKLSLYINRVPTCVKSCWSFKK